MRIILFAFCTILTFSCNSVQLDPSAEIYLMAGQSNMAGRAEITILDTNSTDRIIFLNEKDKWRIAEEPLHKLEKLRGLDCGISFARERLKSLPPGSQVALIPCAVGGSSIRQWLNDSFYRGNRLYSNVLRKSKIAGKVKGVLWMQGENDANDSMYLDYPKYANSFFKKLKSDLSCPIYVALLPNFQGRYADSINQYIKNISGLEIISTEGLNHKGDTLHLDSQSQRHLGVRFANAVNRHILANSVEK